MNTSTGKNSRAVGAEVRTAEAQTSKNEKNSVFTALTRFFQGAFIGLGAVLPGISGGVLCVVFGIYQPIMQLLSHPFSAIKKYWKMLLPVIIGGGFGFVVVSKLLGIFLTKYEAPSVCLFVGLIAGMFPSLFREAGKDGRSKGSFAAAGISFAALLALLLCLKYLENSAKVSIEPNTGWYLFCGFCIALSVIAPGMSFSTLLMPLGLYTPLVSGIGNFDFSAILPAGAGALLTVVLLAKAVNKLMDAHYGVVFHAIIGIVAAATVVIVPYRSFANGVSSCVVNAVCLVVGVIAALLLDKLNSKIEVP